MPMSVAEGVADWLQLDELFQYPDMRIIVSEGSIGWVPFLMERADFSNWRHGVWTKSRFQANNIKPSELMKRHFCHCFLWDPYGLKNLSEVGEDNVTYDVDYPHSDVVWPDAAEMLWRQIEGTTLTDAQVDKITNGNAINWLRFDAMFQHNKREDLTVGACRAPAEAKKLDVTPKASGGSVAQQDEGRPDMRLGGIGQRAVGHQRKLGLAQRLRLAAAAPCRRRALPPLPCAR